jgi:hypothetical protein
MKKVLLATVALIWVASSPTHAAPIPPSVFQFGGIYTTTTHSTLTCRYANPFTSACTCPAGFTAHQIWE